MTGSRSTASLALVLAMLVLTTLGACGEDGDDAEIVDNPAVAAADLEVRVDGMVLDRDRYTLLAGSSTIAFVGDRSGKHTLLIEEVEGFALEVDGGASDSGTVTLEPGTYTIYCDVPGHQDSGMEAELAVD